VGDKLRRDHVVASSPDAGSWPGAGAGIIIIVEEEIGGSEGEWEGELRVESIVEKVSEGEERVTGR
jgi:hypothetical protein